MVGQNQIWSRRRSPIQTAIHPPPTSHFGGHSFHSRLCLSLRTGRVAEIWAIWDCRCVWISFDAGAGRQGRPGIRRARRIGHGFDTLPKWTSHPHRHHCSSYWTPGCYSPLYHRNTYLPEPSPAKRSPCPSLLMIRGDSFSFHLAGSCPWPTARFSQFATADSTCSSTWAQKRVGKRSKLCKLAGCAQFFQATGSRPFFSPAPRESVYSVIWVPARLRTPWSRATLYWNRSLARGPCDRQ